MEKKLKTAIGVLMAITAMAISEKIYVFLIYIFAAILHEAGHLLAAKTLKLKIRQIYFDFSGVRIAVDSNTASYVSEIILALAGPIANLSVATMVYLPLIQSSSWEEISAETELFLSTGSLTLLGASGFFVLSSVIQACINLMPIKSFDGGRALYCFLLLKSDIAIAQRTVSLLSAVFAFLLWTVSLYMMLKVASGLGLFVFSSSIFSLMLTDSHYKR